MAQSFQPISLLPSRQCKYTDVEKKRAQKAGQWALHFLGDIHDGGPDGHDHLTSCCASDRKLAKPVRGATCALVQTKLLRTGDTKTLALFKIAFSKSEGSSPEQEKRCESVSGELGGRPCTRVHEMKKRRPYAPPRQLIIGSTDH